jgi:hypothetical protein
VGNRSRGGTASRPSADKSHGLTTFSDLLIRHSNLHDGDEQRREILTGPNKQRTRVACLPCAAAKLRCSETRPCERCTSRGISCDKPTSSPNTEEHYRPLALSSANERLFAESSNPAAYEDQPEQQHQDFGAKQTEHTIPQPVQSAGSTTFDAHNAQSIHTTQIPEEITVHGDPSESNRADQAMTKCL